MTDPVDTNTLREAAAELRGTRFTSRRLRNVDPFVLMCDIADKVDRLRAVIENAPHGSNCEHGLYVDPTCTCWKADAL